MAVSCSECLVVLIAECRAVMQWWGLFNKKKVGEGRGGHTICRRSGCGTRLFVPGIHYEYYHRRKHMQQKRLFYFLVPSTAMNIRGNFLPRLIYIPVYTGKKKLNLPREFVAFYVDALPPLGVGGWRERPSPWGCSNSNPTLASVTSSQLPYQLAMSSSRHQPRQTRLTRRTKATKPA